MKRIWLIAAYKKESIDHINRVAFEYIHALEKAGALVYILPCNTSNPQLYIKDIDAFIFPWGADIAPCFYWQNIDGSKNFNLDFDQNWLTYIDLIIKDKKNILWICRGMQLINIYFGGNLYQDIENKLLHDQYNRQYEQVHDISVSTESFLDKIFQEELLSVNSLHHQAINLLGDWLKISAKSQDWYIEAIEHKEKNIYWVQFHPECLQKFDPLFKWFVDIS